MQKETKYCHLRRPGNQRHTHYSGRKQEKSLKTKLKNAILNRTNHAACSPLAVEVASTPRRFESLEKKNQMKLSSCFGILNNGQSTGADITKTKIVPGSPNEVLEQTEEIDKNTRNSMKLRGRETKQNMTTRKSGTPRRKTKHEGLQPGQYTRSEGTTKKQMRGSLINRATKAMRVMRKPKRDQAVNSVKNPMCNLPREIDNRPIKIKEVKLAPSGGPVEGAKNREKLLLSMGRSKNQ